MAKLNLTIRCPHKSTYTEFFDLWTSTLSRRVDFVAATMKGVRYATPPGEAIRGGQRFATGQLPVPARDHFLNDSDDVDFIVWSYATPIAWHTTDGWTFVDYVFSATTSKHQARLLMALHGVELAIAGGENRAAREAAHRRELRAAKKEARKADEARILAQLKAAEEETERIRLSTAEEAAARRTTIQTKYAATA